jgi:hypothetical protein
MKRTGNGAKRRETVASVANGRMGSSESKTTCGGQVVALVSVIYFHYSTDV